LLPEAPGRNPAADSKPLRPSTAAVPFLRRAVALLDDEDGWVALSAVGSQLFKLTPDFDQRTYGHAKLSDLVKKTGVFDVEVPEGKGMRIRLKKNSSQQ